MFRSLMMLSMLVVLSACQTSGPRADFDLNRNFDQYRTWTWAEPAVTYAPVNDPRLNSDLTTQRIEEAVAAQLDVRGLRPAVTADEADLQVRSSVVAETRRDNVTTHYGGGWGYWGSYWGGPGYSQTRAVEYQVMTLQIDLLDARDGRLVWRASDSEIINERMSPIERSREMHERVARILSNYPPNY